MGFEVVHLGDMLAAFNDESRCLRVFANFSCDLDEDIEYFLKNKAIINQKMGLSRTYLVYTSYRKKKVLVGYFALTNKALMIRSKVSSTLRKRITGFKSKEIKDIPVFLIGQLAKNFFNNYDKLKLITGHDLLHLAIDKILLNWHLSGGRVILVECADNPYLRRFYEEEGFSFIEKDPNDGLIKYILDINKIDTSNFNNFPILNSMRDRIDTY